MTGLDPISLVVILDHVAGTLLTLVTLYIALRNLSKIKVVHGQVTEVVDKVNGASELMQKAQRARGVIEGIEQERVRHDASVKTDADATTKKESTQ